MIRSILVPLDGSCFAEGALPVALDLARKAHASMRLVMVHEPVLSMVPALSEKEDPEERVHELEYMAEVAAGLDLHGTTPCYEVIVGDARTALMETAEQTHSDLIVMARLIDDQLRFDLEHDAAAIGHRFAGIDHQVEQRSLQGEAVHHHT
jgi:nucleotide-binding universal stress UspA family protein